MRDVRDVGGMRKLPGDTNAQSQGRLQKYEIDYSRFDKVGEASSSEEGERSPRTIPEPTKGGRGEFGDGAEEEGEEEAERERFEPTLYEIRAKDLVGELASSLDRRPSSSCCSGASG